MKKTFVLAALLTLGPSAAFATTLDLTHARGDSGTIDGAVFTVFTEDMQTTVSSGTGVIDPFLTIQRNHDEEGFNSDYIPLVQDTTRPHWNHSIQISDLSGVDPLYYDFLLDINEPNGRKAGLTQNALEIYLVPNAVGGDISSYSDLQTEGTKIWDLDRLEDSQVEYNYDLWNGSGQNMDILTQIPRSLFVGSPDTYVYLYAQFGRIGANGAKSEDGYEEYALREGGTPVPEPATMFLLGSGLAGLAGVRRKTKKS